MKRGTKAFWKAVDEGNIEAIESNPSFLQWIEAQIVDSASSSALHRAARNNQIKFMEYLIHQKNYNMNQGCLYENKTPLYESCALNHVSAVLFLLRLGADVTISKFNDWTPLHIVCQKGYEELVPLLISTQDMVNKEGSLPLHLAARQGFTKIVSLLNSNANVKNNNGRTAVLSACASGNVSCLQALGTSVDWTTQDRAGSTPMHEATTAEIVRWLLLHNCLPQLETRDKSGRLPIHLAALHQRSDALRAMLIAKPELIDALDVQSLSSIVLAAQHGSSLETVSVCMQFQSQLTIQALNVALAWKRSTRVVELLQHACVLTNNGTLLPTRCFGTWRLKAREAYDSVREALACGYRCIDTAELYENDVEVGEAIHDSGIPRSQVFIIHKVWNSTVSQGLTKRALHSMLKRMKLDYLDLVLVHWPCVGFVEAFQTLLNCPRECKLVGVSNFQSEHLEAINTKCGVYPSVNQVEFSFYFPRLDLVNFCQHRGIVVQAYRCLGKEGLVGKWQKQVVSSTQLLSWVLEQNCALVVKSKSPPRIRENFFILGKDSKLHAKTATKELEAEWMSTVFANSVSKDVITIPV